MNAHAAIANPIDRQDAESVYLDRLTDDAAHYLPALAAQDAELDAALEYRGLDKAALTAIRASVRAGDLAGAGRVLRDLLMAPSLAASALDHAQSKVDVRDRYDFDHLSNDQQERLIGAARRALLPNVLPTAVPAAAPPRAPAILTNAKGNDDAL